MYFVRGSYTCVNQIFLMQTDDWKNKMFNSDNCPNCGAESCHHKLDPVTERPVPVWLGIGLHESCKLCGADYEYAYSKGRKPLSKMSITSLLQEARDVEDVYTRGIFMTREQITKNREYLQSIVDVIASANKNHISDRFGKGHTAKLYDRMIALSICTS